MNLSESEVRVLGCLLEKQLTTPDLYPLTLNSLRLACNQSTNRDPVVAYDDDVLRDALRRLAHRGYARLASGRRVAKYRHLLAEALPTPLAEDEHAVLCVLLLRGAQTPGELKQRTERMHSFVDLDAVHDTLTRLIARELVMRLDRRPGQKEERYEHLLSADVEEGPTVAAPGSSPSTPPPFMAPTSDDVARPVTEPLAAAPIAGLEERVARLEREVAALRAALGEPEEEGESGKEKEGESESVLDGEPNFGEPAGSQPDPLSAFQT
jgi:uncharacterized protein YceH (UPF0502 family)